MKFLPSILVVLWVVLLVTVSCGYYTWLPDWRPGFNAPLRNFPLFSNFLKKGQFSRPFTAFRKSPGIERLFPCENICIKTYLDFIRKINASTFTYLGPKSLWVQNPRFSSLFFCLSLKPILVISINKSNLHFI